MLRVHLGAGCGETHPEFRSPRGILQIPPLRTAPVGMTRVGCWRHAESVIGRNGPSGLFHPQQLRIPPLRCAPVGMTRVGCWRHSRICYWEGRTELALLSAATADPSTALRSGRDDKGRVLAAQQNLLLGGADRAGSAMQIPPLRTAPVGMTRVGCCRHAESVIGRDGPRRLCYPQQQQVPPLASSGRSL